MSWKQYKLDQLGSVGRGRSKHRPRNDPKLFGGEIPFIQTADIQAAHVKISSYSQTYSAEGVAQSKVWDKPTLCLTIAGENTGSTAILDFPACFPDSIVGFVPDPEKADLVYVKHALDAMRMKFRTVSKGATQDNLSLAKILSFPLRVPPLTIQQKVASIVGAYDDLIENNRRRISLLEETARMLYREWFVRFRFPGHEHVKIIDGIPEGWERRVLDQVVNVVSETVKPADFKADDVHIGLEHMPRRSFTLADWEPINGLASHKIRFVKGDILFGKIRPYFHKVGFAIRDGLASSDALIWRVRDADDWPLIVCATSSDHFVAVASKTVREGSKMPRADWGVLKNHVVPGPPDSLLSAFNETILPTTQQCRTLALHNRVLAQARDLLLPRLMNGEIAV
ncbi:restriction endonuclease subunit S [Mesorhizobium muleiense]|uniref:restriction endonuclease subunit S n=1 Tax=Mesorhizobium muleiense TaxID=1004279 RepID=UPI001F4697A8|nr:restriction endonuclease subunit S [Mesorhizobium muleiense]MCF6113406.1 restriction endonuclease subunit S [Mesorhizobium muleiense]